MFKNHLNSSWHITFGNKRNYCTWTSSAVFLAVIEPRHLASPRLVQESSVTTQTFRKRWFLILIHSSMTMENLSPPLNASFRLFFVSFCILAIKSLTQTDTLERDFLFLKPRALNVTPRNSLEAIWLKERPSSTASLVYHSSKVLFWLRKRTSWPCSLLVLLLLRLTEGMLDLEMSLEINIWMGKSSHLESVYQYQILTSLTWYFKHKVVTSKNV